MNLRRYIQSVKTLARAWPQIHAWREIFDAEFYLRKYPDVAAAGASPLWHYLEYGSKEGRKPHPLFDPAYYLLRRGHTPAIAPLPFADFLARSGEACISPHPLFDCASYLQSHPEIAVQRLNPLLHYVRMRRALPAAPRPQICVDCATFTFMDVPLTVAFVSEARAAELVAAADIVPVWEDTSGRMRFIAPPEQRPFFEVMSYAQLRAQLGRDEEGVWDTK